VDTRLAPALTVTLEIYVVAETPVTRTITSTAEVPKPSVTMFDISPYPLVTRLLILHHYTLVRL